MKIKSLKIKNIGMISDEVIPFDKPLILFYGDIKQGKTTILNSVRLVMGGSFPADIIKHGANEALIDMEIENGSISRSFYVNKDGVTVSRPQSIVINNKVAGVKDLKAFLNPFLLNQNHLSDMNDTDRIKFIIDLFNVDTTALDSEISTEEINAASYRLKIKTYGVITLDEIEKPDLEKLSLEKSQIETKLSDLETLIKSENEALKKEWESQRDKAIEEIVKFNSDQDKKKQTIDTYRGILNDIYSKVKGTIFEKCFDIDNAKRTLETCPKHWIKSLSSLRLQSLSIIR
jgi:DNA repair ATPase RecN